MIRVLGQVTMTLLARLIKLSIEDTDNRDVLLPLIYQGIESSSVSELTSLYREFPELSPLILRVISRKSQYVIKVGAKSKKIKKRIKEQEKKTEEKKKRKERDIEEKAKSDWMFHIYLRENKGPWVDPDTQEENIATTLVDKAREGNTWANQILVDEYKSYVSDEANQKRSDAFEFIVSQDFASYREYKNALRTLLSGATKLQCATFCRALEGSINAGSFTTRRGAISSFYDNFIWTKMQVTSDLADSASSAITLLSKAIISKAGGLGLDEEDFNSLFLPDLFGPSFKEDKAKVKKMKEEGASQNEIDNYILKSLLKSSLTSLYSAKKTMLVDQVSGEILSPIFGDVNEADLGQGTIKNLVEDALTRAIDKLGEKMSKKQGDSKLDKSLRLVGEVLGSTINNPTEINASVQRKLASKRALLYEAKTSEELRDVVGQINAVFESYLENEGYMAKEMADSRSLTKYDPIQNLNTLSKTLQSMSLDYVTKGLEVSEDALRTMNVFGDPIKTASKQISNQDLLLCMIALQRELSGKQADFFLKENITDIAPALHKKLVTFSNDEVALENDYIMKIMDLKKNHDAGILSDKEIKQQNRALKKLASLSKDKQK